MSYECKNCDFKTGSRKLVRIHVRKKHLVKGVDYDESGKEISAVSNSYERVINND